MNIFSYLLAIAASIANPVQSGANAQLNKGLASPVWSALIVYSSGLACILAAQLFLRQAWPGARAITLPWWAWSGGLLSIASTMAALTLAQKMGSGVYTGLSFTAAIVTSIVLDHFGLIGFKQHPLSTMRVVGSGLMIAGVWLIAKF